MAQLLTRPGVVDAMIVSAIIVGVGVIVALVAAKAYRSFADMSGPAPRRRRG